VIILSEAPDRVIDEEDTRMFPSERESRRFEADRFIYVSKHSHLEGRSSMQPRYMSGDESWAALERGEGLA